MNSKTSTQNGPKKTDQPSTAQPQALPGKTKAQSAPKFQPGENRLTGSPSNNGLAPNLAPKSVPLPTVPLIHETDAESSPMKEASFRLSAPAAHTVAVAGEFTGWEKSPINLIKGGGGTWHTKVALPPGQHAYRFIVDGQWQDDPHAHRREPNPFGSYNAIIVL